MTEKRQKILYIITKSNWGGAQRYVFDLATNLPKEKYEVAVALGGEGTLKTKLEQNGIAVISVANLARDINLRAEVSVFFELLSLLRSNHYDIVHLNSSKIGGLGALAARLARVPRIVFTAHGWAFKESRHVITRGVVTFISWLTVFLSHQTIVVSQDDQKKATGFPFVQKKITLVHNGVTPTSLAPRVEARAALLGNHAPHLLDNSVLWLGTISELHRNKGLAYLIEALANLPTTNYSLLTIIVGEGEERPRLEALIKEKNLTEKIFLVGHKENAASLLVAFDIFTLTSEKEGLPYAILEAGLAGLPVVATNVGGIPEIIRDMESGIVVRAKDMKEIADALRYLLAHPDKRAGFGTGLKQTVQKDFSLPAMLSATLKLYQC